MIGMGGSYRKQEVQKETGQKQTAESRIAYAGKRVRNVLRIAAVYTLVFCGLLYGLEDVLAQSGGKKAVKPRSEVDTVPEEYIQLYVIWIPVSDGQTTIYKGIFVRLYAPPPPSDEPQENAKKKTFPADGRLRACILAPWAQEAIIAHFSDIPASLSEFADPEKLHRRVKQAVQTISEKEVYEKIEVSTEILMADEQSEMLSNTCR